jgi:hypothetical protein
VSRQKRSLPAAAGMLIASSRIASTMYSWPESAFSGLPPSTEAKRRSRQAPVEVGGSAGSIGTLADFDSL